MPPTLFSGIPHVPHSVLWHPTCATLCSLALHMCHLLCSLAPHMCHTLFSGTPHVPHSVLWHSTCATSKSTISIALSVRAQCQSTGGTARLPRWPTCYSSNAGQYSIYTQAWVTCTFSPHSLLNTITILRRLFRAQCLIGNI